MGIKAREGSPHRGHSSGQDPTPVKSEDQVLSAPQRPVSVGWVQPSVYNVCALRQQCKMQNVLVPKPASAARVLKMKSSLAESHVRKPKVLRPRAYYTLPHKTQQHAPDHPAC